MGNSINHDIPDVFKFLSEYAPDAARDYLKRHPDLEAHLDPSGLPLGGDVKENTATEAAVAMLDSVDGVATSAMTATIGTLNRARRFDLAGGILALIASGGVVAALLGADNKDAAVVLALIGFVSSAVPLVGAWLRTTPGGSRSASEILIKLRELVWDARTLRAEFGRDGLDGTNAGLLKRANELAREIFVTLSELGYTPNFRPI